MSPDTVVISCRRCTGNTCTYEGDFILPQQPVYLLPAPPIFRRHLPARLPPTGSPCEEAPERSLTVAPQILVGLKLKIKRLRFRVVAVTEEGLCPIPAAGWRLTACAALRLPFERGPLGPIPPPDVPLRLGVFPTPSSEMLCIAVGQ